MDNFHADPDKQILVKTGQKNWCDLAFECSKQGDHEEALRYCTWHMRENPDSSADMYSFRSMCFNKLGHYDRAQTDAEVAINLSPQLGLNYIRLATAFMGKQKFDQAREVLENAIKNIQDT